MTKSKPFFARYSLLILMLFAFATPLLLQGAQKAVKSNSNKVQDWLPKTFRETTELRWFRQHFVADQFVVISWDGCTLGDNPELPDAKPDDPRIERLAKFLLGADTDAKLAPGEPAGYKGMFQAVTTARRLLDDLTSKPSEIPYAEAHKRLQGVLIGPDDKQTCIVVMLSDTAIKDFPGVLGRSVIDGKLPWKRKPGILWEALAQCGIPMDTVRLGGPPVENVAIDEEGSRTIARLGSISAVLGIGLAWWSLRSIRLTAIVFGCGMLSAAAGMTTVYWSGHTMDAILMSMPSMLYVLAISGAIHLINYYKEALKDHGLEGAPGQAIALGWKPALLCSVTTGIGLGSLYVSDIAPIAKFGVFSAIGVFLMLIMLFFLLPAALQMWPNRAWLPKQDEHNHPDRHFDAHAGTIWSEKLWSSVSGFLIQHNKAVTVGCLLFIAVVGYGVTMMHTSIDLLKLFDKSARVRQDYGWLENNVARLVPMEVVVRFPADSLRDNEVNVDVNEIPDTLSFLERLETVAWIQQSIEREIGPAGRDLVGPAMSAATFAPSVPEGRDVQAIARRTTTNAQLEASHKNLTKSGYLATDDTDGAELWRVSLRAAAFRDLDYGEFVESVRQIVEPVLAAQRLRQVVLRQLVADHPGQSFAGDTVCIWDPRGADAAASAGPAANGKKTDKKADHGIDSQKLFADSWKMFLKNARLKLQYASYDLTSLDEAQRNKLFTALKKFDSVVLAGPFTDAQIQQIKDAGIHAVDARNVSAGRETFVVNHDQPSADTVSAVYTGVVPIVYKAQRALLENLMQSSFWSFVTITPLLMFVSRSIAGGAVAMMPNVLPVLVIFGAMGWLGINIDIGSMMSASIALGVAVDDTIHFLAWYRKDLNHYRDRRVAIRSAYRHCAPPTIQAALISGLSLSVFVLSTFTPTQRMGWLMLSILVAGMVAELVMLPALLAGPLGKAFPIQPQKGRDDEDDHPPHDDPPSHDSQLSRDQLPGNEAPAEPRDIETRPPRKQPARALAENGEAELSATQHKPHAFSLRERLADIRRGARDAGK
jgi:predicted RND superfamily exporter protein